MNDTTRLARGMYVITEHRQLQFPELLSRTETILQAGIVALQYRNKAAGGKQKRYEAEQLQALCADHNTLFVINDDIELALDLEPDGVHLGKGDVMCKEARRRLGEQMLIGISCYNDPERAGRAVADGADYIAFGAMYPTASKLNATEASPGLIRTAKQQYTIPVVAIGGITPDNCLPVIEAGADLLAVISGVYLADAPGAVIDRFNTLMLKR